MFNLLQAHRFSRTANVNVAFLHIPKCAGTSVNKHFKKFLGSARSGRALMINALDAQLGRNALPAAEAAYVTGHCGWQDLEGLAGSHFRFAVIRNPAERIISLYCYCRVLAEDANPAHFPVASAKSMTFAEFCRSPDPQVRRFVDNAQARTLAKSYAWLAEQLPAVWPEQALLNLSRLDFVMTTDRLDDSLPVLCARVGLPAPVSRILRNARRHDDADTPTIEVAEEILGDRISEDCRLYELARDLARQHLAGSAWTSAS